MKRTVLYEEHLKLSGNMVEFAGFELPIRYTSIKEEHFAVRENVGVFDVSHMGEILITGNDSEKFINYLVTNDVTKMLPNQIVYSPMCYENGGCVDDLLIYKKKDTEYLLVVNGSNIEKDLDWINSHSSHYSVNIINVSDTLGLIAVQGPKSKALVEMVTRTDLTALKYYHFVENDIGLISRTGYTGEDGYEIMINNDQAVDLFQQLIDNGGVPCGLGARDTLRFEAGMPLYGHELSQEITPKEAGLTYFIKNNQPFIGSKALLEEPKYSIVGLELLEKGIARADYEIFDLDENLIGHITTGYKSPTLGISIAMALLKKEYALTGNVVLIKIRDKYIKAKIRSKRFYKKDK